MPLGKVRQHALVNYAKSALKDGQFTGDSKGAKGATSAVNIFTTSYKTPDRLLSPVKFHSQWFYIL